MKLTAISGDTSGFILADVYAEAEEAHVVITIDPVGSGRADATLTPDQAEALAAGIQSAASLARVAAEES